MTTGSKSTECEENPINIDLLIGFFQIKVNGFLLYFWNQGKEIRIILSKLLTFDNMDVIIRIWRCAMEAFEARLLPLSTDDIDANIFLKN